MLVVIEKLPGGLLKCLCDCGNSRTARSGHFNTGSIKSCGCHVVRHGHGSTGKRSREYICYHNMIARCCNPKNKRFNDYGGKGITVCSRWLASFQSFLDDMGICPEDMTIDRKDNNLSYYPSNCRWATRSQNQINRGVSRIWIIEGVRFSTLDDASSELGVSTATVAAWCKGRKSGGRFYPAKAGCSYEMVYGESE